MAEATNPYRPPISDLGRSGANTVAGNAVAIRNEYLSHEANVRSVGALYFISAAMMAMAAVGVAIVPLADDDWNTAGAAFVIGMTAFCVALAAALYWLARNVRALDRRCRVPVLILAILGLFNPPFGTLINAFILYLFFGAKGKYVFSEEYAAVRTATPDMKYETSTTVKVLVGLLLLLLVGGMAATWLAG